MSAIERLRHVACLAVLVGQGLATAQPMVPAPATPRVDRLPQPTLREPTDLGALADDLSRQGSTVPQRPGPSLLVFISFAIPESTLSRLVDQASRAQATLVLRGLVDGSLVRTAARVRSLIGSRRLAVQIDPLAFDRYAVARTPTFVLVREDAATGACGSDQCASDADHAVVAGDVSLGYALRHIQRTSPRFAKDAAAFLRQAGP